VAPERDVGQKAGRTLGIFRGHCAEDARDAPKSEIREAIAKSLFPHDFAINDFAFIRSDQGQTA
jgi:hypothetical protein